MAPPLVQRIFLCLSFICGLLTKNGNCAPTTLPLSTLAEPKVLPRGQGDLDPCAQIFQAANTGVSIFYASDVHSCLTSVPFHAGDAKQFLQYYRDTLQFHSPLEVTKNPPDSYQQPSVDLLGGLDLLDTRIDLGEFENRYTFEVAVQTLIYAAHDFHLHLVAGVLSVFTFSSPLGIVSLSDNGFNLPELYILDDISQVYGLGIVWAPGVVVNDGPDQWTPSPITSINTQDSADFLKRYAAQNVFGNRDPYTDWNSLMFSPAGYIQGIPTGFQGSSPFYYGDTIKFGFANGTSTATLEWLATLNNLGDTPCINNGVDFYNYFVLGQGLTCPSASPASATAAVDPAAITAVAASSVVQSNSSPTPTPDFLTGDSAQSWFNPAYPVPIISQANLGDPDGGVVTGYLINNTQMGVLSIPSFDMVGDSLLQFSNTVGKFLQLCNQTGMTKIVIDLQQNLGGEPLLATDTFKHFFPTMQSFDGSRGRAQNWTNILGSTFTDYFDSLNTTDPDYPFLVASPWTATTYINAATGQNFTSWPEYFGPHPANGDQFTTIQQNNYSSVTYDEAATGGLVVFGYANRSTTSQALYAAEDIIILTDGSCHSTCTLFVEAMHHVAGVRTVVAGGPPSEGPMQALGGTRGALSYSADYLDSDISLFSIQPPLPNRNISTWIQYAGFTLRDQIRQGEDFPLQFAYEAADCRIYYTPNTFVNYPALWQYAADAIWKNSSLCVPGSTGSTRTIESARTQTSNFTAEVVGTPSGQSYTKSPDEVLGVDKIQEDGKQPPSVTLFQPCSTSSYCSQSGEQSCQSVPLCISNGNLVSQPRCLAPCITSSQCRRPPQSTQIFFCDPTIGFCRPNTIPICRSSQRQNSPLPPNPFFQSPPPSRAGVAKAKL